MKSGNHSPKSAPANGGPVASVKAAFDRFLSGGKNADPLYLSNRTWKGQLLFGLRIAIPIALFCGGAFWYIRVHTAPPPPPKYDLTPAEVLAKLKLPELKDVKSDTNRDVEVVEVGIEHGASMALAGAVRNNTSHTIGSAEIDFDVSDNSGSRLSTETARFQNLEPHANTRFRLPISGEKAQIAIVRGIRTK
jgi:hypothetical protein